MLGNPGVRKILSALVVAAAGYVLLNLTFLFYWAVSLLLRLVLNPGNIPEECPWFMPVSFAVTTAIIGLVSWLVFRSRLATLIKAIYMTVPTAVVMVIIGIALYRWPAIPYVVDGLLTMVVLHIFYRTRQPWLYFYSVILVAVTLMIFTLLGGEI
jgi:ABC-type branched-subunit amino acid transport system permease subunit